MLFISKLMRIQLSAIGLVHTHINDVYIQIHYYTILQCTISYHQYTMVEYKVFKRSFFYFYFLNYFNVHQRSCQQQLMMSELIANRVNHIIIYFTTEIKFYFIFFLTKIIHPNNRQKCDTFNIIAYYIIVIIANYL